MLIVGLVVFVLFLFEMVNAAGLPFRRIKSKLILNSSVKRYQSTENKIEKPVAAKKKKSNDKVSLAYSSDFSLASMVAGIILTGAGYYYNENCDLRRQLERSQLLSGEISESSVELDWKLIADPTFFKEAVKRGNQELCLSILKKSRATTLFYDKETGQNLLVQLIEKEMARVVDVLLEGPEVPINVLLALDQMDSKSGKTPLLAAIQSKMYPQASRLIKLGAKPMIPKGSYPSCKVVLRLENLNQSFWNCLEEMNMNKLNYKLSF